MYLIAIYDNNSANIDSITETIKITLIEHCVKKISIIHISDYGHLYLSPYKVSDCHLFLVSLDMPNSLDFACEVSKKSPFCKIVFYGKIKAEMNDLFSCRPSALLKAPDISESLKDWLEDEFKESPQTLNIICIETKKAQILMSVKEIIYFLSEGHYINAINVKSELNEHFKCKLDRIQSMVSDCVFVRIHKSYLASLLHIARLDKKKHMLVMDNGDMLPISDYYYKDVTAKIRKFCPLEL